MSLRCGGRWTLAKGTVTKVPRVDKTGKKSLSCTLKRGLPRERNMTTLYNPLDITRLLHDPLTRVI